MCSAAWLVPGFVQSQKLEGSIHSGDEAGDVAGSHLLVVAVRIGLKDSGSAKIRPGDVQADQVGETLHQNGERPVGVGINSEFLVTVTDIQMPGGKRNFFQFRAGCEISGICRTSSF